LGAVSEDVVYTGHWLVFPRAKRFSQPVALFSQWMAKELCLRNDLSPIDRAARLDDSPRPGGTLPA
jgi:hypothetical protein